MGKMDKKTGKKMVDKQGKVMKPRCAKEREVIVAKLQLASPICIESFDQFQQLGRFVLRDEGWSGICFHFSYNIDIKNPIPSQLLNLNFCTPKS